MYLYLSTVLSTCIVLKYLVGIRCCIDVLVLAKVSKYLYLYLSILRCTWPQAWNLCQDELGIKCPLEYLQVYLGDHPCLLTFYNYDPYQL